MTKKYQATIPSVIRNHLGLEAGDKISFQVIDDQVIIEKADPVVDGLEYYQQSQLTEWDSVEDDELFAEL